MESVLYVTDGAIEFYTFPVIQDGLPTSMNILITDDGNNISTSLIDYHLSDIELQQAIINNEIIPLSKDITLIPLDNDQVNIFSRVGNNPSNESCLITFVDFFTEPCDCHDTHDPNGCTHPTIIIEIISSGCPGGGGTPPPGSSTPPAPGSGGGSSGGSNDGGGNPTRGFTGFVIGDGGTANQSDVDLINQITWEMDAAFGAGNWGFDDYNDNSIQSFGSVSEYLNYQIELYNSLVFDSSNHEEIQDGTHLTKFKSKFNLIPLYMNIEVVSILDIASTNDDEFTLIDVVSYESGFASIISWTQTSYSYQVYENSVTVYVNGYFTEGLEISGIGIYSKEDMSFVVTLNKFTGAPTSNINIVN